MVSRMILARSAAARPSFVASTQALGRRTFVQTQRVALKESESADPSPEANEHHKQDSLAKQKAGKGHWKPELASNSEESVKADRLDHSADAQSMKELQEKTKKAAEEKSKAGTSMHDHGL